MKLSLKHNNGRLKRSWIKKSWTEAKIEKVKKKTSQESKSFRYCRNGIKINENNGNLFREKNKWKWCSFQSSNCKISQFGRSELPHTKMARTQRYQGQSRTFFHPAKTHQLKWTTVHLQETEIWTQHLKKSQISTKYQHDYTILRHSLFQFHQHW